LGKTAKAKPTAKHVGSLHRAISTPALELKQGTHPLYLFKEKASVLYGAFSINRRIEDKDEGYQRAISVSRVRAIANFILSKRTIPGAVIVAIDKGVYDGKKGTLTIPRGTDVGWVIDGQHRLAGAHQAATEGLDIEFPVVAFLGLAEKLQVDQFVTINREGKNVPTSLYLDLLKALPFKKPADAARERATDIATELRRAEDSPFFERIVVTVSPKAGQISLTNFVRKISPLVLQEKGTLNVYPEKEQRAVISNYFKGLRQVFLSEFEKRDSIFFKTVGFGALWNAFPTFFSIALANRQGFAVEDVVAIFKRINSFDFSGWIQYGSGNQAEMNAGDDLRTELLRVFNAEDGGILRV
jgi:DGQHR domain-containing protein